MLLKKSAVQFLQAVAFKNIYVENELIESLSEKIVLDFYTSGHPFGSLAIPDLSDAIGLYHANPKLFYVPKQSYLGDFNNVHGDELYIIEEHPDDTFIDVESFGKPDKIESTFDVLENIRKDEKYQIDEAALIKARVFDMLIGDWDRHGDQWRWSRFNISNEEVLYRPIPRDRDQVFSQFDGVEFDVLKFIIPEFKVFHEFSDDIKNVKWINFAGLGIDRAFLQKSSKEDWLEQARFIKENISDDAIDQAFSKLPLELQDETTNLIKENLRLRRANIVDITSRYYDYLSKLIVITATDKNDHIKIHRGDNSTKISVSRIKKGKIQKPYKERVISSSETKEIWVYGLGDKDNIEVNGNGRNPIFIRIVGGQDNDSYTINNGKRIKVYDHKSKPNTIVKKDNAKIRFSDIYENNLYDHRKKKTSLNTIFPSIGFNPDNGFIVKAKNTYIINGFKNKPYQSKYSIGAGYFFATKGLVIKLDATFTETFGKWNLSPGLYYASDYFTYNFFGFSNETENPEDGLGLDYNRVRAGGIRGKLGVSKVGHNGSRIDIVGAYENLSIEETEGRFITDYYSNDPEFFDQNFGYLNVDGTYEYSSYDVKLNPKRGFYIKFKTGVRSNYEDFNETYGYIHPKIEFYNSLTRNKKLVLKTMAQGQFNLGDDFEFFQAAVVGANTGLRGYREQRFSGKSAFAAGGDLRYSFNRIKTGFVPIQIGVFGGYDIGRVWIKEESSSIWHDNVGGGLWINVSNKISGQFGLFSGDENLRFTFGLGIDI